MLQGKDSYTSFAWVKTVKSCVLAYVMISVSEASGEPTDDQRTASIPFPLRKPVHIGERFMFTRIFMFRRGFCRKRPTQRSHPTLTRRSVTRKNGNGFQKTRRRTAWQGWMRFHFLRGLSGTCFRIYRLIWEGECFSPPLAMSTPNKNAGGMLN